jgi:AmmeMemoRadiSam system protein A
VPEIQANEHSLEVQVPFLQYLYGDQLQIVPIVIATHNSTTVRKISDALAPYFNENNLFVISTDFSHYPDYKSACSIDASTANAILKNSPDEFLRTLEKNEEKGIQNLATSVCGWTSVLTLLNITSGIADIRYHEINYMNSGDIAYGDKSRVVGYHAIAVNLDVGITNKSFTGEYLNAQEKEVLLRIARETLEVYLKTGEIPEAKPLGISDQLKRPSGAFVTLTRDKKLRGCIGQFNADKPLYRIIQEMAVSAATHDYRFSKVSREELDELEIEISLLTPMHRIHSIDEIRLGTHGIYIKRGSNSGTLLPQVASQNRWNLEEFLGHCARDKAGIGWEEWKDSEIYTYEAYVFGEH